MTLVISFRGPIRTLEKFKNYVFFYITRTRLLKRKWDEKKCV